MERIMSSLFYALIVPVILSGWFPANAKKEIPLRTVVPEHRPVVHEKMPGENFSVSGHVICLDLRGATNYPVYYDLLRLNYGYEYSFARSGTILFRGGPGYYYAPVLMLEIDPEEGLKGSTEHLHALGGQVGIEPRFYYNLNKRYRKNKRTLGNSGGYLSVDLEYNFPIAGTDGLFCDSQFYHIMPYWGFRRVWGHFLVDFAAGVGYTSVTTGGGAVYSSVRLCIGGRF